MNGHELKIERVTIGLKQIELALRTHIPRERLSRFENGWQALPSDELRRIREVLDHVRADRLRATGTDSDAGQPVNSTEECR